MSKIGIQSIGLVLDIIGVILLAIGALDRSPPTWDDLEKKSPKLTRLFVLAWIGVIFAIIGFLLQMISINI